MAELVDEQHQPVVPHQQINNPPQQQHPQQPQSIAAIVSAGESDHQNHSTEDDNDDDDDEALKYTTDDQLYGANLDDEDEAWVYQNLRSGIAESVDVRRQPEPHQPVPQEHQQLPLERAKLLKPRDSDAVLSCPCCFTIVCMDCQQHETYQNQYRAMFVMNICLTYQLIYDTHSKQLVELTTTTRAKAMDLDDDDTAEVYYSVHCLQCNTQVAALDMKEEVYHFFGCLASS
jgi:E2F-associated phosphoprotein